MLIGCGCHCAKFKTFWNLKQFKIIVKKNQNLNNFKTAKPEK